MAVNKTGLIHLFAKHKVAANLLMAIMILSGLFALTRINVQFLPSFNIEIVSVKVIWSGASAEDIENSITNPLEKEIRSIDGIDKLTSVSRDSTADINVEFEQGSDMSKALEEVRQKVSQVRNLPQQAERPIITRIEPKETVARLIITGPNDLNELRSTVFEFERELLDRGIADIDILGLPEQEIAIQIPTKTLVDLKTSLPTIATIIAARSQDLPSGTIGRADVARQLRSLNQRRTIKDFESMPLVATRPGELIRLGDIAKIAFRSQDREVKVFYQGKPAVEMRVLRRAKANALKSARIFNDWLRVTKARVGKSLDLHVYDERWQYIKDRIQLLLKNGIGGLMLIIVILFLLLHRKIAWWVVVGIPASFLASIVVIFIYGASINMVSLFAFIMALGIIVDDTIVVGEQTLTNLNEGQTSLHATVNAAHKMLAPIMSSSLTTICAFFPLFFITGIIGTILFAIPLVVSSVILASLLECFLVLPGHLQHSFRKIPSNVIKEAQNVVNRAFIHFRDNGFNRIVNQALNMRFVVLSTAVAIFLVSLSLIYAGVINFTFFPTPDGDIIVSEIQFTVGTPPNNVRKFLHVVEDALYKTEKSFNVGKLVRQAVVVQNYAGVRPENIKRGEQYGMIRAELIPGDKRSITNQEFIDAWRKNIPIPAGLESFSIFTPRGGPPGEDIDIEFSGKDTRVLKQAALKLKEKLATFKGVSDIKDDLPFGQEQIVFDLTATGKSLNLTTEQVGSQLRAAFNGQLVQIFHLPNEEIEVRVMLPDNERDRLTTLEQFPIITRANEFVPLGTVVKLSYRRAPDVILHTDTKLTVHVTAKVDNKVNNANRITTNLEQDFLPYFTNNFNLKFELKGKAEEQRETFTDMKYGLMLGLSLIYIILTWVFSSYGWPLVVLLAVPLGLTGAILGHLLMNIDLTILSLFGFFGLSGIVINDSIILINEYKLLRTLDFSINDAIREACHRRLRAVVLTSLTTIAGLTPLLFERSLQAQFLIPMATSISFGLAYATFLILIVIPSALSLVEVANYKRKKLLVKFKGNFKE